MLTLNRERERQRASYTLVFVVIWSHSWAIIGENLYRVHSSIWVSSLCRSAMMGRWSLCKRWRSWNIGSTWDGPMYPECFFPSSLNMQWAHGFGYQHPQANDQVPSETWSPWQEWPGTCQPQRTTVSNFFSGGKVWYHIILYIKNCIYRERERDPPLHLGWSSVFQSEVAGANTFWHVLALSQVLAISAIVSRTQPQQIDLSNTDVAATTWKTGLLYQTGMYRGPCSEPINLNWSDH